MMMMMMMMVIMMVIMITIRIMTVGKRTRRKEGQCQVLFQPTDTSARRLHEEAAVLAEQRRLESALQQKGADLAANKEQKEKGGRRRRMRTWASKRRRYKGNLKLRKAGWKRAKLPNRIHYRYVTLDGGHVT
jgi:biopolymer transport protein ExbB/TolQ